MNSCFQDTAARNTATNPTESFIVQAPAGSGKTELLTQRFLRLLATVDNPESIVAITFTRKAASEMKERVLKALKQTQQEPKVKSYASAAIENSTRRNWNILQHHNAYEL